MTDHSIMRLQAEFARAASYRRTEADLWLLRENCDRASGLDGDWTSRAAAHAEYHRLLADATGGSAYSLQPGHRSRRRHGDRLARRGHRPAQEPPRRDPCPRDSRRTGARNTVPAQTLRIGPSDLDISLLRRRDVGPRF